MAEFALILPILLLIFMGVIDLGRGVFAYNTLSNAAREGARVAIVDQNVSGAVEAAAQRAADVAISLGVDPAGDVDVVFTEPDGTSCPGHSVGCVVTVTVRYDYSAITPVIGNFVGPIALEASTAMTVESTNP